MSSIFFNQFCRRSPKLQTYVVLILGAFTSQAEFYVAEDTTSPNQFAFTSDYYYVDEDATNAIITVDFTPGDRSYSGSVNYTTSNGTATAGSDYQVVSGTLYFSGPGTPIPVITIPIYKDNLRETNETVEIYLSNSNAVINRSHATLIIFDKNQNPSLGISRSANNLTRLLWPTNYDDFLLEKKAGITEAWSSVTTTRSVSNGWCCVVDPNAGPTTFYRLKKKSP